MSDGNITAARTKLTDAITKLCAPRTCIHYDATLSAPSLYDMLTSNMSARQGDTRTPAQSLPPLWVDALQLRSDIDCQVRRWKIMGKNTGSTPETLSILVDRNWRPQDTEHVTSMARQIRSWCDSIVNLFDPEHRKYISAACPSCGKATVYKRDTAGETVRQPALVVITNIGATCQHCDAHWSPDRYLFLCRLLGFELPAGVLE